MDFIRTFYNSFKNIHRRTYRIKKDLIWVMKDRVYGARSAPEGTVYKDSMFSDIPFERLDRFIEDIVKFVFDR